MSNIWIASADNNLSVVKTLVESGAFTANSKDPNGYTPMHAAGSYGHLELLDYLISQGGDINIQDNEGDTPLHHVEEKKMAQHMVESHNASTKIKNKDGLTALEYLKEEDEFPDIFEYLQTHDSIGVPTQESFVAQLPKPGNVDGRNIRYSLESEVPEVDDEKRRQLEEIVNGENPEEALRGLVTSAVRSHFQEMKGETKRRKED